MKIFALFLLSLSAWAQAETVSFHLDHVPVIELAQLIYADVSKSNYAIDSSVLDMKNSVSVHFSDLDKKQAVSVLETLLKESGVETVKTGKVVLIRAVRDSDKMEPDDEIFFYRPRYRTVSYITDLCSGLFKNARFSGQRKVSVPTQSVVASGVSPAAPVPQKPVDSGTSAYSQQSKEQDSFFFTGSAGDVEKLKKLLLQVDVSPGEVLVKALVFEVQSNQKDQTAVGLALNLLGGKLGLVTGSLKSVGDALTFKNISVDAIYSILASDSRFKVVTAPHLRVKSGESARLSVGSDVPVLGAVQMDRSGNPIQSVEYKPSGVILELKPEIRADSITLSVKQQLSNFVVTTTGVNNSPTLTKREISTVIDAKAGETVLLGGLDQDQESEDSSGPRFLPSWLLNTGKQKSRSEILIVLDLHAS